MVRKIHGRRKRYMPKGKERGRKPRFKTFFTEEGAKKHAESLGLKKYRVYRSNYGLGKKFKIVLEK